MNVPSEFLQQIATELGCHLGTGILRTCRSARLHNAFLAKHREHPIQRFRVAAPKTLLSTTMPQESIYNLMVQGPNWNLFVLQPAAEIGDGDDLPSYRKVRIALFGDSGRIGVEVFAQRTLAKSFNCTWEREELVDHPSRVSGGCQNYAAASSLKCPRSAAGASTCGIVRDAA
jgi:hypothetical protein